MNSETNIYFYIVPIVVFGPLFLWILYNFGLKEIIKMPGEIRRERERDAAYAAQIEVERKKKRGTGLAWVVRGPNKTPLGFVWQAITFSVFAALIGFFASSPPYAYKSPDNSLIKLSLSHPGQRKAECKKRSRAELMKLEPNMRAQLSCPRERWPIYMELELDGRIIFNESAKPAGLSNDGPSNFYKSFVTSSGPHQITLRLRDDNSAEFGYMLTRQMEFTPRQVIAVVFDSTQNQFVIK